MKKSETFLLLQHSLSGLPRWISERNLQKIKHLTHYEAVIGIMGKTGVGKTGVGKSLLCNSLFASELTPDDWLTHNKPSGFTRYRGQH